MTPEEMKTQIEAGIDRLMAKVPYVIGDAKSKHNGVEYTTHATAIDLDRVTDDADALVNKAIGSLRRTVMRSFRYERGLPIVWRLTPRVTVDTRDPTTALDYRYRTPLLADFPEDIPRKPEGSLYGIATGKRNLLVVRFRAILDQFVPGVDSEDYIKNSLPMLTWPGGEAEYQKRKTLGALEKYLSIK